MISVSQAIKNSCKADANTHTEYIIINGQTIYIKGKLSATAYKDTTFFGTFNMKVLEFETENTTQYRNRQFEYYKVIDGNEFKVGTFITTEVDDNDSKETIRVTANDYALKFAVPYTTELNYSSGNVTLYDVLEECCTNAGVTLENATITNGTFKVDSNQFVNGEMIGDVISAIAGISGNFATITSQDKLKLLFYEDTGEIIEDYVELKDKRDTQPITSVSIGSSQVQGQEAVLRDEELIEEYGEHWLILNDNPFAYTLSKRQQLVTAIFNKVKGFGYSSFEADYVYRPYYELGDKIKFKNKEGTLVDSIILRYEMDNDNCIFKAPSITSATVNYERSPSAEEIAKRAEIIADQANANITSIVNTVNNVSVVISSGYTLTTDTTYQADKTYYKLENNEYVELIEGTDYDIGDDITGDVYEYQEGIINQLDNLNDTLNGTDDTEGVLTTLQNVKAELQEVHTTMLTQTSEEFIMSFVQGYINNAFNEVNDLAQANNEALTGQERYIRFISGNIELGEKDSEVKLLIQKDRISFMTGENESAYISNNQLYITDSTILNKLQVGHWEIKEDAEFNLNKRWIGGVI